MELIYIAGSGRSGSTLLDLLLNQHSKVCSLGEIHLLNYFFNNQHEPCSCGERISKCKFWQTVDEHIKATRKEWAGRSFLAEAEIMLTEDRIGAIGRLSQTVVLGLGSPFLYHLLGKRLFPLHYQAIVDSGILYKAVASLCSVKYVVDSTKDARRMKALYLSEPSTFRCIYLVRDGRAVVSSARRRKGTSIEEAAHAWVRRQVRTRTALRTIPADRVLFLRYEDLCENPEAILVSVCDFLKLSYEQGMLNLDKLNIHSVGGNPMRFRKDEKAVVLDEKWKIELDSGDLAEFDRIAGRLNASFGYLRY
jgi:hypothetical protein